MANYSVGNIEVGIVSTNKNVVADLDALIKKINKLERLDKAIQDSFLSINRLANGLQKISRVDMSHINKQFDKISKSTKTLNEKLGAIEQPKFADTATALNRLGNAFRQFDKLKDFDFRKMYNSFNSLNRILDPFLQKLKESEASLVAMNGVLSTLKTSVITRGTNQLNKVNSALTRINKKASTTDNIFKRMFNIGKIYWFINYTKRLFSWLTKIVTTAVDFEETLNKFQVSFGEFSESAETFASNLAYAFNISRESLYNYMSTFNSMLKSLDSSAFTNENAYNISKTLTQLALDYSSLFNVTVSSSMEAFQSVLSGQIRTIRSVSGIDVSENTIFQYYQELGGTKSIRNLSQLEKRLLRIYALEKQMNSLGAVGDLAKTINSTSNMMKQFKETWAEIFVYLGNIALKVFKPVVKYTLALSLAIKDMSSALADVLGAKTTEYSQGTVNLFGDISESAEEAEESVSSLLGLLSFDKFEALSSSSSTTDDIQAIINAIALYEQNLATIESDARKIADSMLSWLGYKIDDKTGSWVLGNGWTNIEKIKDIAVALMSLGIAVAIMKVVKAIQAYIISITTASTATANMNYLLGTLLIASIANILINWDTMDKKARVLAVAITSVNIALLIFKNRIAIGEAIKKLTVYIMTLSLRTNGLATSMISCGLATAMIAGSFGILYLGMSKISAKAKTLIGILGTLAGTIMTVATAYIIMNTAKSGILAPGYVMQLVGSIALAVSSAYTLYRGIKQYKDGGVVEQGQMFIANEAGPELVGNIGGTTAVANNDMIVSAIEQASYRGFLKAFAQSGSQNVVEFSFSGTNNNSIARELATPMIKELQRQGYKVSKI